MGTRSANDHLEEAPTSKTKKAGPAESRGGRAQEKKIVMALLQVMQKLFPAFFAERIIKGKVKLINHKRPVARVFRDPVSQIAPMGQASMNVEHAHGGAACTTGTFQTIRSIESVAP